MQSQKFEMLLDSGAAALLEGFTLEACASFAAALERFYEFSLHAAGLRPPPCTVVRETEFCGLDVDCRVHDQFHPFRGPNIVRDLHRPGMTKALPHFVFAPACRRVESAYPEPRP